jgi:NADPH:quinone reductase-like Zn-dependent oxidoreductase
VGFTALQGLRDKGHIEAGQSVLINGASGGVGTFAVQIAKSFGAEVTAVCSTRNLDLVRSIGADHVIDYTRDDFAKSGQQYDLIFDAAASHSVSAYEQALRPGGRCVVAGFANLSLMLPILLQGSRRSKAGAKTIRFMGIAKPNQGDLIFIKALLAAGKVLPVIDRTYPLCEVPAAMRYLEGKHARGKIVITIGQ